MEVTGWLHTVATLYLREVPNGNPQNMGLDEAQSSYGKFVEEKNVFPARAEAEFLGRPTCVIYNTQIALTKM